MSVQVKDRNGRTVTLYNPAEKGEICAFELKNNYNARTGETLTNGQRAYRSGYLNARRDSAKCWKAQRKKKRQRSRKK